ncbi:hypothetical protein FBU59_005187 [Linderina macrospora]|uniref:Uncharacterized protein n=1 Tax=Linderina macrospora TaxID=4868 RepID=A0ACC1J3P6_9FUNG|nr:hypothetical protein FBU59_005187 [Linderina macrospora]
MGAEVVAFSHSPSKKKEAEELGASIFVDTSDKAQVDSVRGTLNFLLVTANGGDMANEYVTWMDLEGQIIYLAIPPNKMSYRAFEFIMNEVAITGSAIGGMNVIKRMLDFAAEHNIRPIIERFPMSKINDAIERVESGRIRYRAVLEN